jgi:hypothetical protein
LKACTSAFSEYENILIRYKVGNLYTWWSDLPVYKRKHLPHFFSKIAMYSENYTWNHFDHLIYQYYLILYHEFNIVNTTPLTGGFWSLEYLVTKTIPVLDCLKLHRFGFGWLTKKTFYTMPEYYTKQKTFLIYHMDHF